MDLTIRVSGQAVTKGRVRKTASIVFSTDAFHAGQDSYSPVSLVYFDRAPFKFTGKITTFYVKYLQCPDLSQTVPGKGYFRGIRFYSPTPSSTRPGNPATSRK